MSGYIHNSIDQVALGILFSRSALNECGDYWISMAKSQYYVFITEHDDTKYWLKSHSHRQVEIWQIK